MAGGMRRPPRLWEQKLEQMIRGVSGGAGVAAAAGLASQGETPGFGGPNETSEPTPVVDPDPTTPRVPNTPIVSGSTLGLTVSWTGTDTDGAPFPSGTTVEVHASVTTGFTPDSTTLKGVITEPGGSLLLGTLTAGVTYFVRLVALAPDGTVLETSAEASAQVGLVQGPEIAGDAVITQIVSATQPATTFANGSIWLNTSNGSYYTLTGGAWVQRQWGTAAISANAITANQIAAQAITSKFLTGEIIRTGSSPSARIEISAANGIQVFRDATTTTFWAKPNGEVVFGTAAVSAAGTTVINGDSITTGTITGRTVRTSSGGNRVQLADSGSNFGDSIAFYSSGVRVGSIYGASTIVGNYVFCDGSFISQGGLTSFSFITAPTITATSSLISDGSLSVGGASVFSAQASFNGQVVSSNIFDNNTTGIDSVGIVSGSNRLRRISSSQAIKYDMACLAGTLSDAVDDDRQLGVATVSPADVLDLGVTEFSVIDDGEPTDRRVLGFIADDVADKFPIAATRDADGNPAGVLDTAILAALLAVVKDQQATIDNLTARLDALEAN